MTARADAGASPPTKAEIELVRANVKVELERRKRLGLWSAGVQPHTEYQKRPLEWIVEKLGISEATVRWSLNDLYTNHVWDGDKDPLVAIIEAIRDGKDCGVESATGTGKTFLAAALTLWFLACFEGSRVVHVAPKEDQLLTQIWMEIGRLWPRFQRVFPHAELLTGKIRMRPEVEERETWAATAFVCGVGANEELAGRAKGFHAEHMLIITEETQTIDAAIMGSLEQTRTDDHNLHLALGNPDHQRDQLHQFCQKPSVVAVRISAFDHPNVVTGTTVVPGAIGRRRLAERKADFPSPDSRGYLSQLRGISPAESYEQLIRWEWCEDAAKRHADAGYRVGDRALGVDAANSEAGDRGAKAYFQGACCTHVDAFPCPDASKLGEDVVRDARNPDGPIDPRYIGVDGVGVGASTVNECRRQGLHVRVVSAGSRAIPGLDQDTLWSEVDVEGGKLKAAGPVVVEAERFNNQWSQIMWRLREDLRLARVAIPYDKELFEDLTAWTYETGTGKIAVCEKDAVQKKLHRSPDKGDALAIGNFVRRRAWLPRQSEGGAVPPVKSRNRDYGLERHLAAHAKRAKAEEQRIRRMFRPRHNKGKP